MLFIEIIAFFLSRRLGSVNRKLHTGTVITQDNLENGALVGFSNYGAKPSYMLN